MGKRKKGANALEIRIMAKKAKKQERPQLSGDAPGCCAIESVVSVDERGQMVLPKEIRDKAGIRPGDKLAIVGWEKDGKVCCISLVKADSFAGMIRGFLAPMLTNIISGQSTKG